MCLIEILIFVHLTLFIICCHIGIIIIIIIIVFSSTIGPIISSTTGMRAIDMGCPQLSMHSIRETMGTSDFTNGLDLFKAFFQHFREIDDSIADKN